MSCGSLICKATIVMMVANIGALCTDAKQCIVMLVSNFVRLASSFVFQMHVVGVKKRFDSNN